MTHKEYLKFFNVLTSLIKLFITMQQGLEELYISGQIEFDDADGDE